MFMINSNYYRSLISSPSVKKTKCVFVFRSDEVVEECFLSKGLFPAWCNAVFPKCAAYTDGSPGSVMKRGFSLASGTWVLDFSQAFYTTPMLVM